MITAESQRGVSSVADAAMARYANGDDEAFTAVYADVAPKLAQYLGRRVGDRSLVADLVQETFLRVHRARATFQPGMAVLPWVLGIARHQVIDTHRRRRPEAPFEEAALGLDRHPSVGSMTPTAEEIVAAKQTAGCLRGALARLSPPQRAALELVKGQGLSLVEAAQALGTSVTGIKLRTHRAYQALRSELAEAA